MHDSNALGGAQDEDMSRMLSINRQDSLLDAKQKAVKYYEKVEKLD